MPSPLRPPPEPFTTRSRNDHFRHIPLDLTADVVIVGGGPAGTWAALAASHAGADVLLFDKGYCGTGGPTASGGAGVWYVDPGLEAREKAMASREGLGGYLADRRWMARVLNQTYENMNRLATEARYPFPVVDGRPYKRVCPPDSSPRPASISTPASWRRGTAADVCGRAVR